VGNQVVYTPNADFNGADAFTYTVTSGGVSETATVNVTVNPVADIADDVGVTNEDTAVTIDVLANDSFEGATPTVTAVGAAANGAVAIVGNQVVYTPNADFNGADAFTYTVTSGGVSETATVNVTVNPVNDAPVLGNNSFTINDGAALGLSGGNLSASDVDDAAGGLVFNVGGITRGYFQRVSSPGAPITSFTQAEVLAGQIQFVHDGSGFAPTFTISVTDGAAGVGPVAANITFNVGGFTPPPPPGGGGGGGGSTTVTPPVVPTTPPAPPPGTTGGGGQGGLRSPTSPGDGGDVEDVGPVVLAQGAPGAAIAKILAAEAELPPIRAQGEVIETAGARTDLAVEPIRAEMQVLPTGHEFAQDDEEKQRIEVVLGTVRITGLALSVGAVWWAARAAGLIASLLASAPAWRHMDPLPVLGRDEEDEREEEHEGEQSDEERERKDDEHRASWVLEGPTTMGER
jgi:hypothetical protein